MRSGAEAQLADIFGETEQGGRLVERVVEAARAHLDMDVGFLAEFRDGREVFTSVAGSGATFGLEENGGRPLEGTYCGRVVEGAIPNAIVDARSDPRVRDLEVTHEADIGAYVGVPVRLTDGRLYGTLCCLSHQAQPDLRQRDVRFMEIATVELGGYPMGAGGDRGEWHGVLLGEVRQCVPVR
jgi:GAF domain-containing protein